MQLNEELFYEILDKIKDREGNRLKITIVKNKNMTKSGTHGEYMSNNMMVATGEKTKNPNWYMNIGTLIHEYAHHLHEKRRGKRFNDKTYIATAVLYDRYSQPIDRIEFGKIVMVDEYMTDSDAYKLMKKWKLAHLFKDWWQMSNWYNLKIKYFIETGTFIYDLGCDRKAPVSNRRWSRRKITAPLTRKEREYMDKCVHKKKCKITMKNYRNI